VSDGSRIAVTLAFAVAGALVPCTSSGAEPPAQCEAAYEGVQTLRQRGQLLAAREQTGVCARSVCPEVARGDCARWADELTREIPSVVVVARDRSDRDLPGLRLLADGVAQPAFAAGRAIELDPGSHVFRVEGAPGGPVEQSVTVYQGERDRIVRIALPVEAPHPRVAPSLPAALLSPLPSTSAPPSERRSLAAPIVVGSLALVSLGASAFLGWTGRQELSDLRSSCAPACTDAQVNPVRARLVASDVTLAVGVVGVAVAVSLLFLRGTF
jgi:hypothetical protein